MRIAYFMLYIDIGITYPMKPTNEGLYSYTSNGRNVGPYLGYQIKNMILNGGILADAEIRDHYDNGTTTVSSFMKHLHNEDSGEVYISNFPKVQNVNVTGVRISVSDVLDILIKWFFASLFASIILGVIALIVFLFIGGITGTLMR